MTVSALVLSGEEPAPEALEATGPGERRPRRRRLAVHLAAYAMILMALAPFMHLDTAWSVDEGLYVYQVRALQQGDWKLEYWAESIDPDGRWFPLKNHQPGEGGFFPYIKSPAYPLLLWAVTTAVGDFGLHLLPLLGALGAAAAAWLLAAQVDRRAAPFAFWIAAAGPVVVNAYAIWAHAPSAAVAGLTAYAAIRALRAGISAPRLVGLCAGVALGVLLRTEGLLFAAAVTATLGALGGIRLLTRAPDALRSILLAAVTGTTGLLVNALEHRWVVSIIDHSVTNDYVRGDALPYLDGRLQGAKHVLWNESYFFTNNANLKVAVVAALVAGLALRLGSRRAEVVAAGAMFVASATLLVYLFRVPLDTVPGIIPAWPAAIFGLLLLRWRDATQVERVLAATVLLALLATLATQYTFGGGFEWGARYLSPLFPLVAALAALAFTRRFQRSAAMTRRHLAFFLVLLALVPAAGGLIAQARLRGGVDRWIEVAENGPQVVITSNEWRAQGAYRTFPERQWLHVELPEIPVALERLAEAGYPGVTVLEPLSDWATEPSSVPDGYQVQRDLGSAVVLTRS
ncbi:MAG: hypothetical protein ACRDQ2_10945 [Gaiellales bacterium]